MFGLQINPPAHRKFEAAAGFQKLFDGIGIAYSDKIVVDDMAQLIDQSFFDKFVEQGHILLAVFHYIVEKILQHLFGQIHIAVEIAESHLRFQHPELCQVPAGVRILGPEGRTESIDRAKRLGKHLGLQLTTYRQAGSPAKKTVEPIALWTAFIQFLFGYHLEHLPCPFTIAGGDDRSMDLVETFALEKFMNGIT